MPSLRLFHAKTPQRSLQHAKMPTLWLGDVMKGSYALILELPKRTKLKVGSLGTLSFEPGYYVYVGSAMNCLERRVARHVSLLNGSKKLRWHIDYLTTSGLFNLVSVYLFPSQTKVECIISKHFEIAADFTPNGFGSSDCKQGCKGHLHFFKSLEKIEDVLKKLMKKFKVLPFSLSPLQASSRSP